MFVCLFFLSKWYLIILTIFLCFVIFFHKKKKSISVWCWYKFKLIKLNGSKLFEWVLNLYALLYLEWRLFWYFCIKYFFDFFLVFLMDWILRTCTSKVLFSWTFYDGLTIYVSNEFWLAIQLSCSLKFLSILAAFNYWTIILHKHK